MALSRNISIGNRKNFWYPTSICRPCWDDPVRISQPGLLARMMGPPGDEENLMVSLAVLTQYINVSDRETDTT